MGFGPLKELIWQRAQLCLLLNPGFELLLRLLLKLLKAQVDHDRKGQQRAPGRYRINEAGSQSGQGQYQ